jgi:hypothetical protein
MPDFRDLSSFFRVPRTVDTQFENFPNRVGPGLVDGAFALHMGSDV